MVVLSDKIIALRKINKAISEKLNVLTEEYEKTESELLNGNNVFINDNSETTYQIIKLDKEYASDTLINVEFKRIICLKGLVQVVMPDHGEQAMISSLNTILIPPKTKHLIKSFDNSEIMIVYKPNFDIGRYKIVEENTIYKKI